MQTSADTDPILDAPTQHGRVHPSHSSSIKQEIVGDDGRHNQAGYITRDNTANLKPDVGRASTDELESIDPNNEEMDYSGSAEEEDHNSTDNAINDNDDDPDWTDSGPDQLRPSRARTSSHRNSDDAVMDDDDGDSDEYGTATSMSDTEWEKRETRDELQMIRAIEKSDRMVDRADEEMMWAYLRSGKRGL